MTSDPFRGPASLFAALFLVILLASPALAQSLDCTQRPFAGSIVIPQTGTMGSARAHGVRLTRADAGTLILERTATTTLDIEVSNPGGSREEAELLVPVPEGAVVRGFSFQGSGAEPSAEILDREAARRAYESIVARSRDPALLEFAGHSLVRSSVFPVEARGTQKLRLTYEEVLPADGNRVDFVLPRSEMLRDQPPWTISVKIQSKEQVLSVYSPSHPIETVHTPQGVVTARLQTGAAREPGPFRLSYLIDRNAMGATLFAYPDPKIGGGYFLLLAGLPAPRKGPGGALRLQREVTLVLDRSGSMRGEKFEQAREAAIQIVSALEDGEHFNLIAFSDTVEVFSREPVKKSRETIGAARAYLARLTTLSGTNIHDALVEALRPKPAEGSIPLVLFLTDGLPTVGQTSEMAIRKVAVEANPFQRRIFTFGVGVDVNTPLLERIASSSRGSAVFVLPGENVEVKVAGVFQRLKGPQLAEPKLDVFGPTRSVQGVRARDILPAKLPDLFEGDQLVVLGKYLEADPLTFRLSGKGGQGERSFEFTFGLEKATTRHSFVPRLWASRKIGDLVDAIRQLEAGRPPAFASSPAPPPTAAGDPRLRELVDEIVRLSTEFGVLSEYTAFLAMEGTDLTARDRIIAEATKNFVERAIGCRTGTGSVNQELNQIAQKGQNWLKLRNDYLDANLKEVAITTVQQVGDLAFYKKGSRWIDSRSAAANPAAEPSRRVRFGSEEYFALLRKLETQGRQGLLCLQGDILVSLDEELVLVQSDGLAGVDGSSAKP